MFEDLDGIDSVRIRNGLYLDIAEDAPCGRLIGLSRLRDLRPVSLRIQVPQHDVRSKNTDQEKPAEDTDDIQLFVLHIRTSKVFLKRLVF